jgi:hypothetical protein
MGKKYAYYIILMSTFACNPMKNIVGNYSSDKKSMVKHSLIINQDGTFDYHLKGELIDASSYGTWYWSNQKELVLKSDKSFQTGVIDYIEEFDSSTESISVKLIDETGKPLSYAAITLNGENIKGFSVDENGYGSYEITNLKSLTINYLGTHYEYLLSNPEKNNLILTIRLQSEESMYFNNEVWKVQKKKLVGKNNLTLSQN